MRNREVQLLQQLLLQQLQEELPLFAFRKEKFRQAIIPRKQSSSQLLKQPLLLSKYRSASHKMQS